jgi:hypothetical protein
VFLLNSRLGRFSAAGFSSRAHVPLTYRRHPLSRSYGVILPSSFSTDHSSTLGFSPRLPVSVCGTVRQATPTRGFSWRPAPKPLQELNPVSASGLMFKAADLPTAPHYSVASGRPSTRRLARFRVPPCGQTQLARHANICAFPIVYGSRPQLRGRLTRSG